MLFCKLLEDWSIHLDHFRCAKVPQTCWDLTADLNYSPLVVFYPPEVVAASVLYIALQLKTIRVIEEKEGKRWFEVCHASTYTAAVPTSFIDLNFFLHHSCCFEICINSNIKKINTLVLSILFGRIANLLHLYT